MPRRDQTDNASEIPLLLLDRIQLMRFHHKEKPEEEKEQEKAPVAVPEKNDTTDSLKPRIRRLGERPNMNQPIKSQPIIKR
jgi:hypothetical protein